MLAELSMDGQADGTVKVPTRPLALVLAVFLVVFLWRDTVCPLCSYEESAFEALKWPYDILICGLID